MSTIIISILLAFAVGYILYITFFKKSSKHHCDGNCSGCSGCH